MYRLGHKQIPRRIWPIPFAIIAIGAIAAGASMVRTSLQSHTVIKQSAALVRHVEGDSTHMQRIQKDVFTMQLPANWTPVRMPDTARTIYSWKGVGVDGASRRLDVYIGATPASLAVNHLLPVRVEGDHLDPIDMVSDNCTAFTDPSAVSPATGTAPSAWNGVHFLCDMANYERDVVAIGSADAINNVTLTGVTAGQQQVLLVYTDNTINPDYSVFVSIVKSFHLI